MEIIICSLLLVHNFDIYLGNRYIYINNKFHLESETALDYLKDIHSRGNTI